MEKIPDSSDFSKRYKGVRLYRDDIDLIIMILKGNGCEIEIIDREFKFESLDELMEKRGVKPSYVKINGHLKELSNVSIIFDNNAITAYAFSYSSKSDPNIIRVIFSNIRDILENRYSLLYKILNPWVYSLPCAILVGLSPSMDGKNKLENPWYLSIVIAFGLVWIYSALFRGKYAGIYLQRKHEGGFWKRNADKLLLLIIGAFIGVVIKYFWEKIMK